MTLLIAAIDVAWTRTNMGIVDTARGLVGDSRVATHEIVDGEVRPDEWLRAIEECWNELASPRVDAVGVAAFTSGLVTLDSNGSAVRPVWDDDRSAPDAGWCTKKLVPEWWRTEVGFVPEARHIVTKLSWFHRSEPDAWVTTKLFANPADVVASRLARVDRVRTSRSSAAATGLFGPSIHSYHPEVLSLIDRDRDWSSALPVIVAPDTEIGRWNGARVYPGFDRDEVTGDRTESQVIEEIARRVASLSR